MIELGNLTLITTMNICDKRCPFCIAKSSGKIYYETEQILSIVETIKRHINMFKGIRIHTSGNIFYNQEWDQLNCPDVWTIG